MQPFRRDMERFEAACVTLLGRTCVSVRRIAADGSIDARPRGFRGATGVMMTDGHGFARMHSYPHPGRAEWRALLAAAARIDLRLVALCPGASGGAVPLFGLPGIAEGRRAPLRAVPWHDGLTASEAAAHARAKRRARPRDLQAPIGLLGGALPRDLLLTLLGMNQDLDAASLRTARLCLSDPERVARELGGCGPVPPAAAPAAGPLDELAVWVSRFVSVRDTTARFSERISEARDRLSRWRDPEGEAPLRPFAERARTRVRAGRGLTELVGDRYLYLRHAEPDEARHREGLDAHERAMAAIEALDGSRDREDEIVGPGEVTVADVTLWLQGEGGRVRLAAERLAGHAWAVRVPRGTDLGRATLRLWAPEGEAPSAEHAVWPVLDRWIELPDEGPEAAVGTVALDLGGPAPELISLGATREEMTPLFVRRIEIRRPTTPCASRMAADLRGRRPCARGPRARGRGARRGPPSPRGGRGVLEPMRRAVGHCADRPRPAGRAARPDPERGALDRPPRHRRPRRGVPERGVGPACDRAVLHAPRLDRTRQSTAGRRSARPSPIARLISPRKAITSIVSEIATSRFPPPPRHHPRGCP